MSPTLRFSTDLVAALVFPLLLAPLPAVLVLVSTAPEFRPDPPLVLELEPPFPKDDEEELERPPMCC